MSDEELHEQDELEQEMWEQHEIDMQLEPED